ncbi:uncharacterized protein LOC135346526 isoform X2 [Halichondria panicea]|uniref:uncharacterized protein LOC135346526 isoform X2 n=1 Tax=Halichondria panicea TaxID=6063 RepID=UPI00312B305C
MTEVSLGFVEVSPLKLVWELCQYMAEDKTSYTYTNPLKSTFQAPKNVSLWSTESSTKLCSNLVRKFYDTILLRRWEWFGMSKGGAILSPACKCMSFSYHLMCDGKSDDAGRLVEAVSAFTECRVFKECEAMLTFLSLLAEVQVNNSHDNLPVVQQKEGAPFRYDIYSSLFFEKPPNHSDLTDMKDDFSESVSLFERTPGTGFDSFLSAHPSMEDQATNTLYHGLVHSTVEDINTPLGLPQLPYSQDNTPLLPRGETSVARPSTTDTVSSLTKEQASVFNTAAGSGQDLFSWPPNGDDPESIREWEGWQTCSRQYLCDGSETCLPHAIELCLSRYCSLGGMAQSEVEDGSSLESKVIRDLDNLPMVFINTFQEGGSVSRMFGEAVQSLQDYFRAQLHQLAGEASGLTLSLSANWILPTVKFLMGLWNEARNLPKGLALLDALYNQTYQVVGTPHYLLLLHLLAQALAPYFKFVEQWVFQGWLDMGEEFGLHVSVEALARRDDKYWNEGYTASGGCAPGFLEGQAHTILTCGKALNLLRICKPSHPLCTGMFRPPKLRVQLSLDGLEQCGEQCQHYRREVQESEQVRHDLLKQELLAKEKELRAEVLKARQEARAHAEKLKMIEESNKAQEKEKKVALRDALLEQIQTNQALRSEHEAEERTEDREQPDYFSSRNTLHEASLQEKAREDMIAYYAGLSRKAELRQLRAEWRAKRYKLSTQRFEFLRSERERFTAESEKAAKLSTPQLLSINSLLRETSLKGTPATSLTDVVSADLNVSQSVENTSNSVVGKTLAESSSQREQVAQQQASRKTWSVSLVDQPAPFGVQEDVKFPQDLDHFIESEPQDQFSLGSKSDSGSTQPVNSTLLLQPSYPPSVVQDLLYNQETTDPSILSRLSQITVPSLHVRSGPVEQPSVAQELLYPTQHAQLAPVQKESAPGPVSSRGQEAPSTAQDIIYMYGSGENTDVTTRGNEPGSTAQDIIYGSDFANVSVSSPLIQEPGHPLLVSSRGQAPRSTAQLKMYPLRQAMQERVEKKQDKRKLKMPTIESGPSLKYTDNFSFNDDPSSRDMLSAVLGPAVQDDSDIDTGFLSVYPLSALIEQSLALPILTQSTLVNEALLRYFLSECHITHHFNVIKWFLLLEDGEFGHALSTRLCEELTHGRDWRVLVSPSFLNPLLSTALEVSVHSRCPEAQRISFALKYRPTSLNTHAIDALEFLQLKYEVDWPCNIVITSTSVEKYNKILQLLLQMKRASWALKNTFHQLKVSKQLSPSQTRQLQVYRHEYQHFVNVMHGYIANQVFQITWREFENDLENDVHSFEELIQAHHNFINKAIFRCLLSKKAAPVMKLIQNIFSSILKFSSELTGERVCVERSYATMTETHNRFREVSGLLIKVVDKLVQRGYQPHLEDFLLRLDFNRFYK